MIRLERSWKKKNDAMFCKVCSLFYDGAPAIFFGAPQLEAHFFKLINRAGVAR